MNLVDLFSILFPGFQNAITGICGIFYRFLCGFATYFMTPTNGGATLNLLAELWERLFC